MDSPAPTSILYDTQRQDAVGKEKKKRKKRPIKAGQAGLAGKFCKAGEAYIRDVWQAYRQYAVHMIKSKGKCVEQTNQYI